MNTFLQQKCKVYTDEDPRYNHKTPLKWKGQSTFNAFYVYRTGLKLHPKFITVSSIIITGNHFQSYKSAITLVRSKKVFKHWHSLLLM